MRNTEVIRLPNPTFTGRKRMLPQAPRPREEEPMTLTIFIQNRIIKKKEYYYVMFECSQCACFLQHWDKFVLLAQSTDI